MRIKVTVAIAIAVVVVVAVIAAAVVSRKEGFAEEHKVCNSVYYFEIPGFLSHDECDDIVRASKDMFPSQVGGGNTSVLDTSIRKSVQTWFAPGKHPATDALRQRTKDVVDSLGCVRVPFDFEDVQVVRYDKHGKYDAHYDGDECDGVCPYDQRLATMLVYLNDDFEGGHTHFPLLNASVVPQKGKALFFWVADADTRDLFEKTLHAGTPVSNGHKWIANQWIRPARPARPAQRV